MGVTMHARRAAIACPARKVLVALVSSLFAAPLAFGNPVGPAVVSGTASFATAGKSLTVTNSPSAIINWQGFSIGTGEATRFVQQSAASAVLNRVVGQDPSAILGTLSSNGRVFLLNPNGILFGAGSRVDVAGLVASTLNLSNQDFLAGRLNFEAGPVANSIVNYGNVETPAGGRVYLIAPNIENHGVISTPQGQTLLAAGKSVQLVEADVPNLRVEIQAGGEALNVGQILAEGGSAGIYAGLINQRGIVRADSATRDAAGNIVFRASDKVILDSGSVTSASSGSIAINADVVIHTGTVDVSGASGGSIVMQARNVLSAGRLNADGTAGAGGSVSVEASGRILQTAAAHVSADGTGGDGGAVTLQAQERVFGSGLLSATGSGKGGEIKVLAGDIVLLGAAIDASGNAGGGTILVGGDFQGRNPAVPNATTTSINFSTTLKADALATGDGGKVIVWSDNDTKFYGTISARGGAQSGNGGFMEISGKENLTMGGFADAGAPNGTPGTLLLDPKNIIIDSAGGGGGVTSIPLVEPNPGAGDQFAKQVVVLANNNIVATDPNDDFAALNAGAAYLFNGTTGALISSLQGTTANDQVGRDGVTALSNGNYVVRSAVWNNGAAGAAGAVTFGSGTTGVSGAVSAANSLVGSTSSDQVGSSGVTALTNGNYVVRSPFWDGAAADVGAVTWGNGAGGTVGAVSAANSLVGSTAQDRVGFSGVTALNNGNYVVGSQLWINGAATFAGAVTFGRGTTGVSGVVSAANSLVGSSPNDAVGSGGVTALSNGNYVVISQIFNNGTATSAGAVTFGSGTTGVSGAVSNSANSLTGSTFNDQVGRGGVTALTNGNYVVISPLWSNGVFSPQVGAVTFGSGTTGALGLVSAGNSLVGTTANDHVGINGVTALSNGNYVVISNQWKNGAATQAGAVTFGSGTSGISGAVSAANSLVGTTTFDLVGRDGVTALANGNYVVRSSLWNNGAATSAGAVTFGSGATGVTGAVSAANSLVGTSANDGVSSQGVTALSNGNYVVRSPGWNNGAATGAGAVTFGSGTTGITGSVSPANSLVGTTASDFVGSDGVTALSNGNYVVGSSFWKNGAAAFAGAVTFGSGTTGVSGAVSAANSLVGTSANDNVSSYGITALSNGNYVVSSADWTNGAATFAGAVTFGSGTTGISGAVSAANSLVGTTAREFVGADGVTALTNGNYVVRSSGWNNGAATGAGAVTFGSGTTGISGAVSATNSLVGTTTNDRVGFGGITGLSNGSFVVRSPVADNGALVDAGLVYLVVPPSSASGQTFAANPSGTATLTPAAITTITNTGTAVVLQANNDITLAAASNIVTSAGGAGGALTMQAGRSVLLNSNITTDNGSLTIKANEQLASRVVDAQRDAGAAVITMAPGTTINAGSGAVTIALRDGAGLSNSQGGAITLGNLSGANVTLQNDAAGGAGGISILGTLSAGALTATTNGGNFNVTGTTTINSASTVTVGAGNATFAAVEGPGSLAVNSSGVETFGAVGTVTPLASITTDAPGTVSLGGNVTTTGAQTFNDAVTAGSVTLTSTGGGAIFVNNASSSVPSGISTTGAVTLAGALVGTSGAPLALLVTPAGLAFTQLATAFLSAPSIPAAIAAPSGSSITINGALFAASAATALSGTPAACSGLLDPTTGACTPAPQIPPPPPQVLPPAPPQASAPPQDTGGGTAADAGTPATGEGTGGTETRRRRAPRCG